MRQTLPLTLWLSGAFVICVVLVGSGCGFFESGVDDDREITLAKDIGDSCKNDSHCREGLACDNGTCQPAGDARRGSDCRLTAECRPGLYCSSNRKCQEAGDAEAGEPCETTADCEQGLICSVVGFALLCSETGGSETGDGDLKDTCDTTADCMAGLTCLKADNELQCTSARKTAKELPVIPMWDGVQCEDDDGPATAYFEVPRSGEDVTEFYRLPFPNDIRRSASGIDLSDHPEPRNVLGAEAIGRYLRATEGDVTGFATTPVVIFRFSEAVNFPTISKNSLHIIDITPDSPTYGEEHARAWRWNPAATSYVCDNALSVASRASSPLRARTTYAVYATTDVKPKESGGFARSSDFEAMLGASAPSDADLAAAHQAYAPFRAWLQESNTSAQQILNAAVFTTQNPEAIVPRLRSAAHAQAQPEVTDLTACADGVTSPCADDSGERDCSAPGQGFVELHGRISLPMFQTGTAPFLDVEDGGYIELDDSGIPRVAGFDDVCFSLVVPTQSPPEDGYPLMIYAHGTGGSFTRPVHNGMAENMATAGDTPVGAATLAIDMPQHGERRGESDLSPDMLFFNFANPRAARDNVLQGAADLMSLVRWARGYSLDAGASPTGTEIRFDASRIAVFGHSQGATHLSLMLPYEPDILAAVLSGHGGHLTRTLLTKTEPIDIATALPFALMDADKNGNLDGGSYHPMLAILQTFFDRVDPLNFAHRLQTDPASDAPEGHHVFMTYGLGDSFSTEETQQAYAHAAGLTAVRPLLTTELNLNEADPPLSDNVVLDGAFRTIGLRTYQPGEGQDGHFVALETQEARMDVERFLLGALAGARPEIGE